MTAFHLAGPDDDADLRHLLRENGMPSWVEMTMEREPSYFAGVNRFGREWAVIAKEHGDLVGMYSASVLPLWVNGALEQVGYLGGLRVRPAYRRRIRHLREGYTSIVELAPNATSRALWFTIIAEENHTARRLLESGVAGLPRYRQIGRYVTCALATSQGRSLGLWRHPQAHELPALLGWQRQTASRQQLSPALDEETLARIGLENAWMYVDGGAIQGFAMLWNQSAYKQVVARRYRGALAWLRPAYNLYARLARRVELPALGRALEQSSIAFLALSPHALTDRTIARALMTDLLSKCATPVATLGLHAEHPLLPVVAKFKAMRYSASVYTVELHETAHLDNRPVQPEAALF